MHPDFRDGASGAQSHDRCFRGIEEVLQRVDRLPDQHLNSAHTGLKHCGAGSVQSRDELGVTGLPAPQRAVTDTTPSRRALQRALRQERQDGLLAHRGGLPAVTFGDGFPAFCGLLRTFSRHSL